MPKPRFQHRTGELETTTDLVNSVSMLVLHATSVLTLLQGQFSDLSQSHEYNNEIISGAIDTVEYMVRDIEDVVEKFHEKHKNSALS